MSRILRPPRRRPLPPPRTEDEDARCYRLLQTLARTVQISTAPASAIVKTSDNVQINIDRSILAKSSPVLCRLIEDDEHRAASLREKPCTTLMFELECPAAPFLYALSCCNKIVDCPVTLPLNDRLMFEFWKLADDLEIAPAVLALKQELHHRAALRPVYYFVHSWRNSNKTSIASTLPFLFGATPYGADYDVSKHFEACYDDLDCKGGEFCLAFDYWMAASEAMWDIVSVVRGDVLVYPWMPLRHAVSVFARCTHSAEAEPKVRIIGKEGVAFWVHVWLVGALRDVGRKLREYPSPTTVTDAKHMLLARGRNHCSDPQCAQKLEADVVRCLEDLATHVLDRLEKVDCGLDKVFERVNDPQPYGILYKPEMALVTSK